MRRPINWIAFSITAVFLFVGLTLAGCGGGGTPESEDEIADDPGVPPALTTGMLRPVRDAAELEAALKASLRDSPLAGAPTGGAALPTVGTAGFSGTYTLEAGVDEVDPVRYDGTHLYVARSVYGAAQATQVIRILRTDPASGTATEVSSIPLPETDFVLGMYVANGRMVLLCSQWSVPQYGDLWMGPAFVWAPTRMTLRVFDVSDPAHPAPLLSALIDGAFVASRRVGDQVFLVSRFAPAAVLDPAASRAADAPLNDLLPQVTIDGRRRPLVSARRCYVTNDEHYAGYPVLTTITVLSLREPQKLVSTCYAEAANGVYASPTALYVSEPRSRAGGRRVTRIHKFSLSGALPEYAGSAEVAGELWGIGQTDFRLSEHEGLLRVMTSEGTGDPADDVDNRLFILRQDATEAALDLVSQLPNDARPEEIGKPGERMYGVRFAGPRAYAVTFQRVDPLYVFDLANPADPNIAGRLELPGFSDFLHPVTENLLLGLGLDQGHLKVELFDVSVLAQPLSRGAVTLGGFRSSSEALYERHAFTYLPDVEGVDRFAIPVDTTTFNQNYVYQSALYQFEIQGKQNPASASLRQAGSVFPPSAAVDDQTAYPSRSFIHGDTVYYVRGSKVWSSAWLTPGQVQGPF